MTKQELLELRAKAEAGMKNIAETRGDNMDADSLSAIKEFKTEIDGYDNQINAMELIRSVAMKNSAPKADKVLDAEKEMRSAFVKYYRGEIDAKELRDMSTALTAGGDTIDDVMNNSLLETLAEYGSLFGSVSKIQTAEGGTLSFPIYDDTANEGAIVAEGGTITSADAVTSTVTLGNYKIGTSIVVSRELLEDSKFNIEGYLTTSLGRRLSKIMETLFLNGTGSSQPTGILVSTATKDVATAAINVIDEDDFLELIYSVQPNSRAGAKFYVADSVMKIMQGWKDSTGRPLLQSQASATQANGILMTIFGYPVEVNYGLDVFTSGTAGNSVMFGNPTNYMVRQIADIRVERSTEVHFTTDEVVYKATARFDSDIIAANDSFAKLTLTIA